MGDKLIKREEIHFELFFFSKFCNYFETIFIPLSSFLNLLLNGAFKNSILYADKSERNLGTDLLTDDDKSIISLFLYNRYNP